MRRVVLFFAAALLLAASTAGATPVHEPVETATYQRKLLSSTTLIHASRTRSEITARGRIQSVREQVDGGGRSRGTRFTWDQGERVTTTRVGILADVNAPFGPTDPMRVQQTIRDEAGRVLAESVESAAGPDALLTPATTIGESRSVSLDADLVRRRETAEPRVGRKTEVETDYDGLARPVVMTEGGGAWTTLMGYDEEGNLVTSKAPGLPAASAEYDSRGLPVRQTLPDGTVIRQIFDELGNPRRYIDEEGRTTSYEADELGRVVKVVYPDATTEEVRYENGTGLMQARRNRAGEWLWFEYDPAGGRLVAEHLGGNGTNPTLTPSPFTRYEYDERDA